MPTLKKQITKMLKPLRAYKTLVLTVCSFSFAVALSIPYVIGLLLDRIEMSAQYLLGFIVLIGAAIIVDFFLNWVQNTMWFTLSFRASNIVRKEVQKNILYKSPAFHKTYPVGDLTNKIINDAASYADNMVIMMPILFLNLLRIIIVCTFLALMNVVMAAICIGLYVVYLLMYMRLNKQLRKNSKKQAETFSRMQERANESLNNIDMIQVSLVQKYFSKRFATASDSHENNQRRLQFWKSLGMSSTEAMLNIIPVCAVIMGVVLFQANIITIGQIVAFYVLLPQLGEPFRNLADFNMSYQGAKGLEERLAGVMLAAEELEQGKVETNEIQTVAFENLKLNCYLEESNTRMF